MRDASSQPLPGVSKARGAEWAPRAHWLAPHPLERAMASGMAPGEAVEVYANEGRWVVACPDCNSAQLACRTDRRFMCHECANVAIEHRWREVDWPADAKQIEAALKGRLPRHQNWLPAETVEQLNAENAEHGGR